MASSKPGSHKSIPTLAASKAKKPRQARSKGDVSPSKQTNVEDVESKLSDLTIELRQKQRLVAQINNQTSNIDEKVKQEIFTRDSHIDKLNERILELEQVANGKDKKASKRNQEVNKIYKDVNELLVDNHNLQNRCLHYETQLQAEKDGKAKEKEEHELLTEALNEEVEDLKKQLVIKDQQNEDTKQDVVHMSKIVQDMTGLNNELNEKIASLNVELERLNSENFAVKKKAEHIDELEKNLADSDEESKNLLKETKKQNSVIEYLKSEKEASETCFNKNSDSVSDIETKLIEMSRLVEQENSPNLGLVVTALREMSTALGDIKSSLQSVLCRPIPVNVNDNEVNIKDEVNSLKSTIVERDRELRKHEKQSNLLNDRFEELQATIAKTKSDNEDTIRRDKVRIDRLDAEVERLKKKSHTLREKLGKSQIAVNKSENKNAVFKQRNDEAKKKIEELNRLKAHLEAGNKEMRASLLKLQTEKMTREQEFQAKDQRAKKAVSLIKAYENEVFVRDSEILKKESNIGQLKNIIEDLKRTNATLKGKMKTMVADEIEQANRILADRDNEIKILKEMVRSTQSQMKTIEKDAFSIKKRIDGPVSETRFKKRPVKKQDSPMLKAVLNFITEVKDLDKWIKDKRGQFTAETMDAAEIKQILGVEIKGTGELNVEETLTTTRSEMGQVLYGSICAELEKHNDKINTKTLRKRAKFEKLNALLDQRGGDKITGEELKAILGQV